MIQIVGCTSETLATFRQFQADGGFAIPTSDFGQFNELLDAECTGLLLYENESQMLRGLWRSTQVANSGAEVHAQCCHPLKVSFTLHVREGQDWRLLDLGQCATLSHRMLAVVPACHA